MSLGSVAKFDILDSSRNQFILAALAIYVVLVVFSPDFVVWDLEAHVVEFRLSDVYLLFLLGYLGREWLQKGRRFFFPNLARYLALYVGGYFISTVVAFVKGGWSQGLQGSFFALKHMEYFFIFLIVVNLVESEKMVSVLVNLFILLAFLAGLWLILNPLLPGATNLSLTVDLQDLSVNYHNKSHTRHTIPFARGLGPSGEFMEVALPLVLFTALSASFSLSFAYYSGLFLAMVAGFLFTGSRAPIGSFFGSVGMVGPILNRRIIYLIFAGALITGLVFNFVAPVRERLSSFFVILTEGIRADSALEKRVFELWPRGLEQFLENPVFGRGLAGFKNDDTQYIRILANQGLVGVIAFGFFVFGLFKHLFRVRRYKGFGEWPRIIASGLIVTVVALLINGITATSFQPVRAMEPFMLLLGLVFSFEKFRVNKATRNQWKIGYFL